MMLCLYQVFYIKVLVNIFSGKQVKKNILKFHGSWEKTKKQQQQKKPPEHPLDFIVTRVYLCCLSMKKVYLYAVLQGKDLSLSNVF